MPSPPLSAPGEVSPASGCPASSGPASGSPLAASDSLMFGPASTEPASAGSESSHLPASHTRPSVQSASLAHVLAQLVAAQPLAPQSRCGAFSQPPAPSQLAAPVAMPLLHAGAVQLTSSPGYAHAGVSTPSQRPAQVPPPEQGARPACGVPATGLH